MPTSRTTHLFLFIFFVAIQMNHLSFSQVSPDLTGGWVKKLEAKDDIDNKAFQEILGILNSKDSGFVFGRLHQLESSGSTSHYFKARLLLMEAQEGLRFGKDVSYGIKTSEQAINQAYETGNEYLISYTSWFIGVLIGTYQQIELSVTYFLKADEIADRLEKKPAFYNDLKLNLGESFFHSGQYQKCIDYVKKGLHGLQAAGGTPYFEVRYWNTVGQAYKQLGQLDSAIASYQRSIQLNNKVNDKIWKGINSVFLGEVYLLEKDYPRAKQLIEYGYKVKYTDEPNVSAYGLWLIAKLNLATGERDSALWHLREALQLLKHSPDFPLQKMDYLQNVYNTAADVFVAFANQDSFYYYNHLYVGLHDSLERVATLSNIKLAQLRIDNENNYHNIQALRAEEKSERLIRNLIIAVILLLSVIAFFYVNRMGLKHRHKEQLANLEIQAAKKQMELFTQNLVEKSNLIDQLQGQLNHRELSLEHQELAASISTQTILTEVDWEKFKSLFEKIYPGFFINLKEKVNDITLAEQRMAALTRLHLTTRQIGSILGISPNSVNKTRQRLRQRLNLDADVNMEELIANI